MILAIVAEARGDAKAAGFEHFLLKPVDPQVLIDLVLAGDNAVVIGLAAAGLLPEYRSSIALIPSGAA